MKDEWEPKYEFTGETAPLHLVTHSLTLNRIRAIRPFGSVKAGELGGWIEDQKNLSQRDLSWVGDNAAVFGNAKVYGEARVGGRAEIYDHAEIYGNARVYGSTRVCSNARVYGDAWIYENAMVYENAIVSGNARIHGDIIIGGKTKLRGEADVFRKRQILTIGPIGSREAFTTFYRGKERIMVSCGCFNGPLEAFITKVREKYGTTNRAAGYLAAVELAKIQLE